VNEARRLWHAVEPLHAVTYFAPEARAAYEAVGLQGFWRGYFASRASPLGAVGTGAVSAVFFGFHPDFVRRALPSIWSTLDPHSALEARLDGAVAALCGAVGELATAETMGEASRLVLRAALACDPAERPLFGANLELDWPDDPLAALWHGATLLREHRGDGHVVALVHAELDGTEAHVARIAGSGDPVGSIQPYRGWSAQDWDDAAERLRKRRLLDAQGHLTAAGRELRDRIEADTDRLAATAATALSGAGLERLLVLLRPLLARLAEGVIPYPNPMGVPRLEATSRLPGVAP
jgi:hypothetical protein